MLNVIDKDGNKTQVENIDLENAIRSNAMCDKIQNVTIVKEDHSISYDIKGVMNYIGGGWIEDYGFSKI